LIMKQYVSKYNYSLISELMHEARLAKEVFSCH
jgi:hypothetical protein